MCKTFFTNNNIESSSSSSSSSSSKHANSTDSLNSLSPSIPISYPTCWVHYTISHCEHRTDKCKFLLVDQHRSINVLESIGERHSCVRRYFYSSTQHVFSTWSWSFIRKEENGCTTAVFYGTASWICSKEHVTSLYSSTITFSSSISLESKWCNYSIVLTGNSLEYLPFYFFSEIRLLYSYW